VTLLGQALWLDQVYANLRGSDENITAINRVINRDKRPATTGTCDTFARFNHKKCTVVSALDHSVAAIEELVFNPFERNTEMRAAILVEINFVLLFDGKQLTPVLVKTLAAPFWNVSKGTEAQFIR
jgi:hypothetical protein